MKRLLLIIFFTCYILGLQAQNETDTTKSASEINREYTLKQFYQMVNQDPYSDEGSNYEDNLLMKRSWVNGWYCLGGIGYSLNSLKDPERSAQYFPAAFHVSSAIGYHSPGGYAYEFGSYLDVIEMNDINVLKQSNNQITNLDPKFNKLQKIDLYAWNTLFYMGLKSRFPNVIRPTDTFNPYFKILIGKSVTVYFPDDAHDDDINTVLSDKRIHIEGYAFGFSISNIYNTFNKKPIWFWELTFTTQINNKLFYVQESGELPLELAKIPTNNSSLFYVLRLSIGTRFF